MQETRWAALVAAYLWGSIPWSWLIAWWAARVDLRHFGSASVGVSNVQQATGWDAAALAAGLDVNKGLLPAYLALHAGWNAEWAMGLGVAAALGHCWSPWLGWRGGRGVAVTVGTLFPLFWPGAMWLLLWLLLGRWVGRVPEANLVALITLPVLVWLLGASPPLVTGTTALTVLLLLKRLEANRLPPPPGLSRREVLRNRLLYDRDVADRDAWVRRQEVS